MIGLRERFDESPKPGGNINPALEVLSDWQRFAQTAKHLGHE
jgi:hypothetical protein